MSRSGYTADCENVAMWRGVIRSATRGKRGQRFFRELVTALDAMPEKALVAGDLQTEDGAVCALGALGLHKGSPLDAIDTYDHEALGAEFDIAPQLSQEVMYENDEGGRWVYEGGLRRPETSQERWVRIRKWAAEQIRTEVSQ